MTISHELADYSDLLLTVYRLAQEIEVNAFQDRLLQEVQNHLPFDSSMWGTATMQETGIDIHNIHLFNSSTAMLDAYEKVKQQDTAALRVSQQDIATISFHVDEFEGAELRQFLHDFGHLNFVISSDINPRTHFVQWISLYRASETARYNEVEVAFLASLAPHLMQALAINRVVHLDQLTHDAARSKWAVAIADQRGVVYHADARFSVLLAGHLYDEGEIRLSAQLLVRLGGVHSRVVIDGIVISCKLDHGLLYLRARRHEMVDTLSARELVVARLISTGLTQNQVALQLDRSVETIRSQLKSIFTKLHINSVVLLASAIALLDE